MIVGALGLGIQVGAAGFVSQAANASRVIAAAGVNALSVALKGPCRSEGEEHGRTSKRSSQRDLPLKEVLAPRAVHDISCINTHLYCQTASEIGREQHVEHAERHDLFHGSDVRSATRGDLDARGCGRRGLTLRCRLLRSRT